jgi:hypothetical protein
VRAQILAVAIGTLIRTMCHVMADGASGNGAQNRVMASKMAGDPTHDRALQAASSLGSLGGSGAQREGQAGDENDLTHGVLRK